MDQPPQQQPTPQPEKSKKKFFKTYQFWAVIIAVLVMLYVFIGFLTTDFG